MTVKHHRIAVLSVYRSPSVPFTTLLSELQSVVMMLSSNVNYILIGGDFNVNLLVSGGVTKEYLDLLADFQLSQKIKDPTRVCDQSATLIDHVTGTSSFNTSNVTQTVGISDHRVQVVDFDIPSLRPSHHHRWIQSFRKCDWDQVRTVLQAIPWHLMDTFDSIDDKCDFFHTVLSEVLDLFLPLHSVHSRRPKQPTPWFSDDIRQLITYKNKAKHQADRSGDPDDKCRFQRLKNELKTSVRQAKVDYLQMLMQRSRANPMHVAGVWSHVNTVFGRNIRNRTAPTDSLALNQINDHFQTVAISSDHESAASFVIPSSSIGSNPFTFSEIPVSLVCSHLQHLDTKKSIGPDGLSARFLKSVMCEIAVPLTKLFNESLKAGVFPSQWKRSHITPVHKGGATSDPGNFRPISVVPVLAKSLEKIVSAQLSDYFEQHSLLRSHQGAYQVGKSTEDILLVAVDFIVQCLDKGNTVCASFLDFRKAFNSLDHHILLDKLFQLDIGPAVLKWFQNYLSDRSHRVKGVDNFSEWRTMKGGIPQGSALGPYCF